MSAPDSHRLGNVARVAIALERMTPLAFGNLVKVADLAAHVGLPEDTVRECLLDLGAVHYAALHLGPDGLVLSAMDLGRLPQVTIPERVFKGSASCG